MAKRPQKNKLLHPYLGKSPLKIHDPAIYENSNFHWRATERYIDYDDREWGWGSLSIERFFTKCLNYLQHYESKTWAKIKEEDHCHPVPLEDIVSRAKRRIIDKHGDMDDLYQVTAEGRCRLFGWKDRQVFYLIWHDEHHTVYPGGK